VFFHIDLDAFFAAVELLDDPSLAGRPVIVGAEPGRRGVVSTCSYEARRFGVHSAMPISEAARLCPEAVFLPVRMSRYAELSSRVMALFEEFTPDVIRVSIDEASLDMTGTERLWGEPARAARLVQGRVEDELGLSVSVGVAPNRYVAKIASGLRKPAGLVVVHEGEEAAFMRSLRLKDLWGVGEKSRARLSEYGIEDLDRLLALSLGALESIFGKAGARYVYDAVRGIDPGVYAGQAKTRSMSSETTFEQDCADRERLESTFLSIAEELASRLYAEGSTACTVFVRLRYGDFETLSAQATGAEPRSSSGDIYKAAIGLFYSRWDGRALRLVGLGVSGLAPQGSTQPSLFEPEGDRGGRVERAGIEASRRGLGRLTRARLLPRPPGPSSRTPS